MLCSPTWMFFVCTSLHVPARNLWQDKNIHTYQVWCPAGMQHVLSKITRYNLRPKFEGNFFSPMSRCMFAYIVVPVICFLMLEKCRKKNNWVFVCVSAFDSQWTDLLKIWYLNIFRKSVEKLQVSYLRRIAGTIHEYVCIFMIISRSVLLRMRNISDKRCREYQNADVMLNIFFFRKSCRLR